QMDGVYRLGVYLCCGGYHGGQHCRVYIVPGHGGQLNHKWGIDPHCGGKEPMDLFHGKDIYGTDGIIAIAFFKKYLGRNNNNALFNCKIWMYNHGKKKKKKDNIRGIAPKFECKGLHDNYGNFNQKYHLVPSLK